MSLEQITGKCYHLHNNKGQRISLSTRKRYCIDHSHPMINILGIWESTEECLRLYGGDVENNRIGGSRGFIPDTNCWDVLARIHDMEQVEQKRRWYFKKQDTMHVRVQNSISE